MRKFLFLFSVLVASAALGASRAPVVYDITGLMTDPSGEIPLIGGKSLRLNTRWNGAKVLFEDKLPGANWEHPASFKVVASNGKVLEEVASKRPPEGLENAPVLSGEVPNFETPEFKLNTFEGRYKVKDPSKFHAILINGRADKRHWNDFSFLYRVLTQIYGYNQANIIVVDGVYKDRTPDLDGDGDNDIQYTSTLAGIKEAMGVLKTRLKAGDQLVLAVNDHGGTLDNESTIIAYDGDMKVSEFVKLLKEIKAERVLTMYEQCYSGGFVRPSLGSSRVSMAAATNDEYSWASKDLFWDEWIYHVIAGFAMQKHDGTPVTVDLNADGKVSTHEAFAYSVAKEEASESPLLESSSNTGDALTIGLGF